ncbi:coproporphyrinogen dehydrogenase HemZ [Proteiniborus sp.]|uniref:coproporphyrinogen dehydrogenase HemZ n=1 Tax=Proteiniborus sp. TaxID=2079015 RepID=UPI0033221F9D
MIYVCLEGHNFRYEVNELVKVFYFNKDINFIENKALTDTQSLLIMSTLTNTINKVSVNTKVYEGKEIISSDNIDDISKIDIKDNNDVKIAKLAIKQSIFDALSKINSIKVPWGILTGIRPTKIVHNLLGKGVGKTDIMNILIEEYKLKEDKAKLTLDIAVVEKKVTDLVDNNKFSLYVNIPFCPTRCLYCSFLSNPISKYKELVDIYTDKLIYEIHKTKVLLKDKIIDTVYIGGGTPTSLPVENLNRIIKSIYESFNKNNIREFTVEAGRPDTITRDMLLMLRNNDIKRISINPQTMCQKTLSLIGRKHTPQDIIDAFKLAKDMGFETINMDIIVGLPEEGPKEIRATMEEIMKLNPENLTVHTMAIKRASRLKENLEKYSLAEQNTIEEMLSITKNYASNMGMHPYYMYRQKQILGNYENVGYSRTEKECIYNILIMEEKQTIIAVGAGGITKIFYPKENRIERVPNVKDLKEYIARVEEMIQRKEKYIKTLT